MPVGFLLSHGKGQFAERGHKIPLRPVPLNGRDIKDLVLAKLCFQSNRCFVFGVHSCFLSTEGITHQLWVRKGTNSGNLNPLSKSCCVTLGKPHNLSVLQGGSSYLQCAGTLCE